MRRWMIAGTAVVLVVVLIGVGLFALLRGTTRFDERAYPGSSWSERPEELFSDFSIVLPACTEGRMRYWTGRLSLLMKITGPPECISQFIKENRMRSSEPTPTPPATIVGDRHAAEFGWELPADRLYTGHYRSEGFYDTTAYTDDAPEQSLYLYAWHR